MKNYVIMAAGFLAFTVLPVLANPINFPECPAVGADTTGCELLITVTGVTGMPGVGMVTTAFTVTASSPDLGPFDAGLDDTLIGVLNASSSPVNKVIFKVGTGVGSFAFDGDGACKGTTTSIYTPGPTAAQCLNGQYWTTDAMDYASAGVTFCSFSLANACVIVGEPAGTLAPDASTWFSLPGALTASEITVPTPEPSMFILLLIALLSVTLVARRRSAIGLRYSVHENFVFTPGAPGGNSTTRKSLWLLPTVLLLHDHREHLGGSRSRNHC
jgi:hypothetical protein